MGFGSVRNAVALFFAIYPLLWYTSSSPRQTGTPKEHRMREKAESWVVYKMTVRGNETPMNAVCERGEWDAMELLNPGRHLLVQSGISTESQAEKLARGTSG